ncbi:hypothetical protein P5V15_008156 [Pogonomyrmex californicus]
MSAASWGTFGGVQARRYCSINNTQPNRSQHIPFTSSTHFILLLCAFFAACDGGKGNRNRTNIHLICGRSCHSNWTPIPREKFSRSPANQGATRRYRYPSISQTVDAKTPSFSRDICLYGSRGTRGSLVNEETKVVSHKRVGGTRHRGGMSAGEKCRSVPIRPQFDAAGFYLGAISLVPEELATDMTK